MEKDLEEKWQHTLKKASEFFGEEPGIEALLFIIGVQELGKGYRKLNKDQKIDIMHVAICTLLSSYGYYEFEGLDEDGWPHWRSTEKLPYLKPAQQHILIKQSIIAYFAEY